MVQVTSTTRHSMTRWVRFARLHERYWSRPKTNAIETRAETDGAAHVQEIGGGFARPDWHLYLRTDVAEGAPASQVRRELHEVTLPADRPPRDALVAAGNGYRWIQRPRSARRCR